MDRAPDRPRCRLLLMSVGCLVGTALLECIEAIGRDEFELIGMNSEAGAPNNFRTDVCYLSPPASARSDLRALRDRVVAEHAPDLVVPLRDDDVVVLAHWAAGSKAARALAGCAPMAEVIRDKWASCTWATQKGLPFARSAIDAAGVARLREEVGYPLVAKPRDGFGSHGVRLLLTDDHVAATLAAGNRIVQEAIDPPPTLTPDALQGGMPLWYAPIQPGSPLGLALLDDDGCRFLAAWQSSHVRGAAVDTVLLGDPALERLTKAYAAAAWEDGWRGLFSLQARRTSAGDYVPIELAGRFMGGTNALHRLGIPVAAIVLRHFVPSFRVDVPSAPRYDARAVKQVTTHVVHRTQEATLRQAGVWRRA
jgi:hypothetical protein